VGKVAVVNHERSEITLSMVKWGPLRRLMLSFGEKRGIVDGHSITPFVPKYEIAIYDGGPQVVFSQKPYIIFYYPDASTAFRKWGELATIFEKGGLYGSQLSNFIEAGHPREQGVLLVESLSLSVREQIERLMQK